MHDGKRLIGDPLLFWYLLNESKDKNITDLFIHYLIMKTNANPLSIMNFVANIIS